MESLPYSLGRALWKESAFGQYRRIYSAQKVLGSPSFPSSWLSCQQIVLDVDPGPTDSFYVSRNPSCTRSAAVGSWICQVGSYNKQKVGRQCGSPGKARWLCWFSVLDILGAWGQ